MSELLSLNEAVTYLFGISGNDKAFKQFKKRFINYSRIGEEIECNKIKGRYYVDKKDLKTWGKRRNRKLVSLDINDYLKCFEFATKSFYQYLESGSTADFLRARERGIGKWAEDFLPGKLGEIAVAKFLVDKFKVYVKLDFSIGGGIPAQDFVEVAKPRRGPKTFNPAKIRTSIKTTKAKNVWLAVPKKEFNDITRRSDAYILTRLDLPLNHLARFLKESKVFARMGEIIPQFKEVEAEVVGYAWRKDLKFYSDGVPGTPIERPHYALPSGKLRHTEEDWKKYISKL